MKPIIRVENVGKRYRIGTRQATYGTLRDTIAGTVRSSLARRRNGKPSSANTLWALKEVNFEVEPGEIIGIIGSNGAGKSTLLKLLSRVTAPTIGRIELYGRLGSLLEVGTGFHPELTGRENIYLNGAILGMKRAEIKRNFDDIVAFAEVERFIDTPVKHYSTGMYLRLAFAVAAQLEPEILLVDEVLAVGDANFQKKCMGKMGEVAKEGRTILFVSHNMTAINQLCPLTLMLSEGRVARFGNTPEVVAEYLKTGSERGGERTWENAPSAPGSARVRLHAVRIKSRGQVSAQVDIDQETSVEVEFWNHEPNIANLCVNIYVVDSVGNVVLSSANTPNANSTPDGWYEQTHERGLHRATCTLPANFLNEGRYYIDVYLVTLGPLQVEVSEPRVMAFDVFDTGVMREAGGGRHWAGVVRVRLPWQTKFVRPIDNEARTTQPSPG
ncbi:MAG TPA: ABC transporter ATP-binding protein [Pyrinomonadaceae bacterium]|jgi:lipopolysaccharide transport system ATP-binding protein